MPLKQRRFEVMTGQTRSRYTAIRQRRIVIIKLRYNNCDHSMLVEQMSFLKVL